MAGSATWRLAAAGGALAVFAAVGASNPLVGHAAGVPVSMKESPPGCARQGYCFTPASVTVSPGDTVTWTDQSDANHTVTRCTASACSGVGAGTGADAGPASGQVSQGNSFSMTFNGAGTYNYYCTVHGYAVMHGTVTVSAASSSASSSGSSSGGSGGSSTVTTPATGADPGWISGLALIGSGMGMLGGAVAVRRRRSPRA